MFRVLALPEKTPSEPINLTNGPLRHLKNCEKESGHGTKHYLNKHFPSRVLKKKWQGVTDCSLCLCQQETTAHLLTQCNFSEALWNLVANRYSLPAYAVMSSKVGPLVWVNFLLAQGSITGKRMKLGILFAFWWQPWKERNRRIFYDNHQSTLQVYALLQDQIACLSLARDLSS
jgi:hypothetical protein